MSCVSLLLVLSLMHLIYGIDSCVTVYRTWVRQDVKVSCLASATVGLTFLSTPQSSWSCQTSQRTWQDTSRARNMVWCHVCYSLVHEIMNAKNYLQLEPSICSWLVYKLPDYLTNNLSVVKNVYKEYIECNEYANINIWEKLTSEYLP